jgi:AcrR family transcriptional regulator
VTSATAAKPYHHGDLRNALVAAAVELAREGGPNAIVLREAARRVGVSPNAAYRHFASLPELVAAVARRALGGLTRSMQAEIKRQKPTGDAVADAWHAMGAIGRGYVKFALAEPGLFRTAFDRSGHSIPNDEDEPDDFRSPFELVTAGLQRLIDVGLLRADELDSARMLAWSSVHGLSLLLLGPMDNLTKRERTAVIEATLEQLSRGLLSGLRSEPS